MVDHPASVWAAKGSSVDGALELARRMDRPMRLLDFAKGGIHQEHVSTLVRRNLLIRVGRGMYRLPGSVPGPWADLAEAALRWPTSVVCGVTASAFHGIVPDDPSVMWLAVLRSTAKPRGHLGARKIRMRELAEASLAHGISTYLVDNVEVRMMDPIRSLADTAHVSSWAKTRAAMTVSLG